MSDFDLDRLGDVWRRQPDAAEMERLQRSAAAVNRRARFSRIIDIVTTATVAAVVIALVIASPRSETIWLGAGAILILLYSNFRQRRLREVELRSLTGSTEAMLQQSIERVETTLRYNRFTAVMAIPGVVVGWRFATASIGSQGDAAFSAFQQMPLVRMIVQATAVAALAAFILFMLFAIRRGRRELEKLKAMREAYRHERESTVN